ncbi:uncharacterized protein METZ01_LOCUS312819, partial [marine metagenome]
MKEVDKKTYELIAEEIDTGNTQKALWTKAFSDAEGDDKRTEALYIKYRFEEISNEELEYHEDEWDDEDSLIKNKSFGETSSPKNSLQDEAMTTSELVKDGNQYFLDYQNKISSQKRINKYVSDMKKQSYPKVTPKIDGFLAVVGFFLVLICIFFGLCSFLQFSSPHDLQYLVFHHGLFYQRPDLFYEYVELYQWRLFGEFLLILFLTFKFFKKSKDFVAIYCVGIPVDILVAYSLYYQLVLEV